MSSILDALRKVEAEKTKKKVDLHEIEAVLAEKDFIAPEEGEPVPRTRGSKRAVTVMALVVVVAVSGVATFFIYNALRGASVKDVTETAFPGRVQAPRPPVPQPIESEAEPIAAAPATAEPTGVVPEPPAPETKMAPQPAPAPSKKPPAKTPARRPELRINILRPPSELFATGLAVVNGKKVAVGDHVDGAEVIKIQEDGILFDYGDDLFLVKF